VALTSYQLTEWCYRVTERFLHANKPWTNLAFHAGSGSAYRAAVQCLGYVWGTKSSLTIRPNLETMKAWANGQVPLKNSERKPFHTWGGAPYDLPKTAPYSQVCMTNASTSPIRMRCWNGTLTKVWKSWSHHKFRGLTTAENLLLL